MKDFNLTLEPRRALAINIKVTGTKNNKEKEEKKVQPHHRQPTSTALTTVARISSRKASLSAGGAGMAPTPSQRCGMLKPSTWNQCRPALAISTTAYYSGAPRGGRDRSKEGAE